MTIELQQAITAVFYALARLGAWILRGKGSDTPQGRTERFSKGAQ